MNNNQTVLDLYNARYNNLTYRAIRAAFDAEDCFDSPTDPSHHPITDIMNLVTDAALWRCGHSDYVGTNGFEISKAEFVVKELIKRAAPLHGADTIQAAVDAHLAYFPALPTPQPAPKQTDWLFASWLASSSDWALAERIERYETKLGSGMSVKTEAIVYELKQLKGEQARRTAFKLLAPNDYTHNQPIHMCTGKHHYSNSVTYERFGAHLVDQYTKDAMDRIIEQVKGIDPALFSYLIDRLPDSFIDPIIIKAEEANDCVYLVGDKAIGD